MNSTDLGAGADEGVGKGARIAYFVATFPSLRETFVLREIESLEACGFDVIVVALRRAGERAEQNLAHKGLLQDALYARPDHIAQHMIGNIVALSMHPRIYLKTLWYFIKAYSQVSGTGGFIRLLYHFFAGVGFARICQKLGIRHIHAHFTSACNMGFAAVAVGGFTFSFTAHASGDIFSRPVLLQEKLSIAEFVIAVCEYSRRYLDSITGFAFSRKIHLIYNGISLDESDRLMGGDGAREEASSKLQTVVSVGGMVWVKGFPTLLETTKLLRMRGYCFRCEIIGDGPERPLLEELIVRDGLERVVMLRGAQPLARVYEALYGGDIFVLLSEIGIDGRRDGFPTVILEAMATGLPVVSTWISGIPELVDDGVTGFLVPERDPAAAADAIELLLTSEKLRRQMGAAGQERIRKHFSASQAGLQRARLFERFLRRTRGGSARQTTVSDEDS